MALFRTILCIFITNSQPNAYLHFAVAPLLGHHSILSHLYSVSLLPLVIFQPSIHPLFPPFCLSICSPSCSSLSSVQRSLLLVSIPAEQSWYWAWGQRDGQSCSCCQQLQMGLDTVYVETPKGHPHLLWALDRHAHSQKPHTLNQTLLQA